MLALRAVRRSSGGARDPVGPGEGPGERAAVERDDECGIGIEGRAAGPIERVSGGRVDEEGWRPGIRYASAADAVGIAWVDSDGPCILVLIAEVGDVACRAFLYAFEDGCEGCCAL